MNFLIDVIQTLSSSKIHIGNEIKKYKESTSK